MAGSDRCRHHRKGKPHAHLVHHRFLRGFGRQVALRALHNGDRVVATARAVEALKDLQEVGGDNVLTLPLDVTDPEQVVAAATEAEARFGGIDVLFNNAGIGYFAAVEESDEAEIRRMMEINVFGLAAVTNAVFAGHACPPLGSHPQRLLRRRGAVVPGRGWYNASKFAVEGLSEALAQEVAPLGIKVVLVEPSGFATDWAGNSAAEVTPEAEIADYAPTAGTQRAGSALRR